MQTGDVCTAHRSVAHVNVLINEFSGKLLGIEVFFFLKR